MRFTLILSVLVLTSFNSTTEVTEIHPDLWCKHENTRYKPPCYGAQYTAPITPTVAQWLAEGRREFKN